jgi:hypothetical protein
MEVGWDAEIGRLFSPKPREWTYPRWFRQILTAVADECGVLLRLAPTTIWSGISESLRSEIEAVERETWIRKPTTPA